MFERFTRSARDVVVRAQEESAALGHDQIGTEHLLLGLAARGGPIVATVLGSLGVDADALRAAIRGTDPGGLDADALAAIGIDLDAVRRSVEESFGPGALGRARDRDARRARRKPFSARAKRALERSVREAIALRGRHLGPEHLLLGVSGDPDGRAAAALRRCGTSPDALRAATLRALRDAA
jgi:ATP-dependent Clp protease ATP-binding subunit ClpA